MISLSTILLPQTLTKLGEGCFYYCVSIDSFDFSVQKIREFGNFAFYNCFSLQSIQFPVNLAVIGSGALGSTKLNVLILPSSIEYIGTFAFYSCVELHDVNLVETNIKDIPEDCFALCSVLTDILLPPGINRVLEESFYLCTSLQTIDFKGTEVEFIGRSAFANCNNLLTVLLPSDIEILGPMCFAFSAIKEFIAPRSLRQIGYECFFGCNYLQNVNLSNSIVSK
ncbi:surface antigen BspA-like [Trichomonas vaginalis G3]|uniref:Surface antigen BspA-like n=1 Tax=Trichomonas vaginalis (strain ATCC PRA-98 / G3) TaxID=412133 RepID=A2DMK8_TRIV3|nr:structural constituent of cell wall [Trichomonas vaginalis G3]EAY18435.1 surface antigen BspA-like [Trichomonas vaginalis G3]KAI5530286.1 structural constituent of cell wall [Trichomonas vaginalis G3]|eukprot:XP_001579421.1 surface antigen BspA-like [Trichomonas vaginalis G3]